jgi:hypothetical protein
MSGSEAPVVVAKEAYQLDEHELASIELELCRLLQEVPNQSGLTTLMLTSDDPFSDFVRTYEAGVFGSEGYDFHAGMRRYEDASLFLMTLDLEKQVVAHVKRIVNPRKNKSETEGQVLTGIEVLDDRLTALKEGEKGCLQEILAFHGVDDVRRCFNLTSNIQTGRCQPSWERPYSLISYKGVFKLTQLLGIENIFAYMNAGALRSLGRLGVHCDKLGGREFHLPLPGEEGKYDAQYLAVVIPGDAENVGAFVTVNPRKAFTRLIASLEVPLYSLEGGRAHPFQPSLA